MKEKEYEIIKDMLSKQTRYFIKIFDHKIGDFVLNEINPFTQENWTYAQIDASIRTAFYKYNLEIPPYVVIEELTYYVILKVFRGNISSIKNLAEYEKNLIYVQDELNISSRANSTDDDECEDWIKYEFKIL